MAMKKLSALILIVLLSGIPARADRLFTCGFEENDTTNTMWTEVIGLATPTFSTSTVRSGTYSMRCNTASANDCILRRAMSAADTAGTYNVCFHIRIADAPDTLPQPIFMFGNANSSSVGNGFVQIKLISGPKLRITSTLPAPDTETDGSTTLNLNQWYSICVEVVLSDTGSVTVKLDNVQEIQQSSVDTLDGASGLNRFYIGVGGADDTNSANYDVFFDDLKINDEVGLFQTSQPTYNSKIAFLETASDSSVQWATASGCTLHSDCVDDLPGAPDDDTTYIEEAATLNNVDRLNVGSLPAGVPSTADMILVDLYARTASTQTATASIRLKIWDEGGNLTNGPSYNAGTGTANQYKFPSVGPTNQHQVYDLGARSKTNTESFDFGYENVTDTNTRSRRVTALWGNVEWIEGAAGPPTAKITGTGKLTGTAKIK